LQYVLGSRRAETPIRYLLLAGVAIGLALRFVRLGGQSLWVDEIITLKNAHIGEGGVASGFFSTLQGPLVGLIVHFWGLLGSGDGFLRLPFAFAGALTVIAIYLLARSLCESWTTLHTVFVTSLSPILIWYSQEIRGYAFVVLFSILASYFFIQWLARPTTRNGFYYGLFLFAGLVSNLSAVFIAAAHLAYLLVASGKRKMIGRWVVAVFIVLLVFSPWVREIIERVRPEVPRASAEPLMGGGGLSVLAVPYAYFTYGLGYTLGPSIRELQSDRAAGLSDNMGWVLLGTAVLLVPAAVGVVTLARSDSNLLVLLLAWLVVPVAGVALLAALNVKVFTVRYGLVAVPALMMIVGQGLARITRTRFWPFLLLFAALVCLSIYNYMAVPEYGKEDARQAARLVRDGFRQGDVVVAVYTGEALEHYLKGTAPVNFFGADDVASPQAMEARCRELAGSGRRVWLCLCRERMIDSKGTIRAWFDHNMNVAGSASLPGIELYLYQGRGD
jgi:mannosyltransferase